jgi:hypothetical protein
MLFLGSLTKEPKKDHLDERGDPMVVVIAQ